MATKMKLKATGILTQKGLQDYAKRLNKEKLRAYKKSIPQARKTTKEYLGNEGRKAFRVRYSNYKNLFTSKLYDTKPDRLPGVLFFTRTDYSKIFETGGTISPKNAKGLFIPFIERNNRGKSIAKNKTGAKDAFMKTLLKLKAEGKTFWRKINGKLILFAIIDKDNRGALRKERKSFSVKKGLKSVKSGTAIPVGILEKSVRIKRRFAFSSLARDKFTPELINYFNHNINMP